MDKNIKEKGVPENCASVLMWGIAVAFFVYQFVARSAFPTVLTEEYMKYFNLDAKEVGALVSCYYIFYTIAQIPAGIIIDKYSIRLVMSLSIAVCAAGVMMFVSSNYYIIASAGQMLVGLGSAFAFIGCIKTVTSWFPPHRRAAMISYTISIGSIGPVIFGPTVALLVKKFPWIEVMITFSLFGFVLSVLAWLFMRDKEEEDKNHQNNGSKTAPPLLNDLKIILSSRRIWILSLLIVMQYAPLSALADLWGTQFIKKLYNADSAVASLANNMIYLGLVVGSPFFAWLAKKINSYKNSMTIGLLISSAAFTVVQFCHIPIYGMFAALFVVGFSCGALLEFVIGTAEFPGRMSATVTSVINMSSMVSGIILMPLIGWIVDLSWDGAMMDGIKLYSASDYRNGFFAVLASLLIALGMSFFVKESSRAKS
ncbi:MAG: MFS transporter [Holosporaceae bacterium]|jgi:MFS family permease|nr:MFS transporter [Holosporaceae bacterium]